MKTTFRYSRLAAIIFMAFCFMQPLQSQVDFSKADSIASHMETKFTSIEDLADSLTISLHTPIEQARVFYMWIAHNVRYDIKKFNSPDWSVKPAAKTMKSKRGICGDYSTLFKALCDYAKIECVIISGDGRDFNRPYRGRQNNPHAWNAIKIEGNWYLIDVTWGAGYVRDGTKFVRQPAAGYFMTPPTWFALNHLPNEEKWQLIEAPISAKAFAEQPMINFNDPDYPLKNFSMEVLPAKSNPKKQEVWFEFENSPKAFAVANKNNKQIPCEVTERDGKIVLTFSKSPGKMVKIYAGKSYRSRMNWLAVYK